MHISSSVIETISKNLKRISFKIITRGLTAVCQIQFYISSYYETIHQSYHKASFFELEEIIE